MNEQATVSEQTIPSCPKKEAARSLRVSRLRIEIAELEGVLELYGHKTSDLEEQRAINRIRNTLNMRHRALSTFESA